jgi:two-component system, OmpR family, phosphate regulon sensor histidine kinase PhoR
MLLQVVLNLLSNAIKYTPEGGRITVSADMDGLGSGAQRAAASPSPSAIAGAATIVASVIVTVADTGLGIPPDALPKLFDKFYRVENYKRIAKGTGLGLSLCKHIVETAHRGQIGVDSELGMGSKFWFSIPVHYAGSALNKAA